MKSQLGRCQVCDHIFNLSSFFFLQSSCEYFHELCILLIATLLFSGVSQCVLNGVLRDWGSTGLDSHLRKLQVLYTVQRDNLIRATQKHLSGLVEFEIPVAGMFLWIKVLGVNDAADIVDSLLQFKVFTIQK
jgi:DNA-binding transcriptional MocR family regulator